MQRFQIREKAGPIPLAQPKIQQDDVGMSSTTMESARACPSAMPAG